MGTELRLNQDRGALASVVAAYFLVGQGKPLREVLLEAGAVRFKPILLTALAAMIGAATILPDPIFQGLAISLLFGLASSTLLTVLVVPAIYVVLRGSPAERSVAVPAQS
jgi:multidrug efflux pump subunit AcrB